jgi:hypothetical protein
MSPAKRVYLYTAGRHRGLLLIRVYVSPGPAQSRFPSTSGPIEVPVKGPNGMSASVLVFDRCAGVALISPFPTPNPQISQVPSSNTTGSHERNGYAQQRSNPPPLAQPLPTTTPTDRAAADLFFPPLPVRFLLAAGPRSGDSPG